MKRGTRLGSGRSFVGEAKRDAYVLGSAAPVPPGSSMCRVKTGQDCVKATRFATAAVPGSKTRCVSTSHRVALAAAATWGLRLVRIPNLLTAPYNVSAGPDKISAQRH
eukprot:66673-Rhodomonas_salina.11